MPAPIEDIPPFMRSDPDTEQGQEMINTLTGDETPETPETPAPAATEVPAASEEPAPAEPAPVETPAPADPVKPKEEAPAPGKPEEEKEEAPGDTSVLGDEKPEEETPAPVETPTVETPAVPVVEETASERMMRVSEEALKRSEDMTGKLTKSQEYLKKNLVIDFKIPAIADFANEDGTLKVEEYLQAALSNFAMGVQQNLAGGQLASLMFGTLHAALTEDFALTTQESSRLQNAEALSTKLEKAYPILKTNEKLGDAFGPYVIGKWEAHAAALTKKNEKPGRITFEFVEKELQEFLKIMNITVTPAQAEVVPPAPKGGAGIKDSTTTMPSEDAQMLKDIEDMAGRKKKTLF